MILIREAIYSAICEKRCSTLIVVIVVSKEVYQVFKKKRSLDLNRYYLPYSN